MRTKKILILILLFAAFLRFYKLSEVPVSLFGDELDVGYHAYSILKTGKDYSGNSWPLHFQSLAEWRTPLYLYSAVPTVAIWGISPLGVRVPAAIFGVLSIFGMYLLVRQLSRGDKKLALLSAFLLTISPWHIQYSRAAFEVTLLLVFLIFGIYFFLKSLKTPKYLWASVALLVSSPLVYSTAKLFVPGLLLFLFFSYKRKVLSFPKKELKNAIIAGLVVGLPVVYATLFGGGGQRFSYIGVFTDPTIPSEVSARRLVDARVRKEGQVGQQPSILDRAFHNKLTFWTENIGRNILQSFSTDFLFIKGDLNLRHSIDKVGQFYRVEVFGLVLGLFFFFSSKGFSKKTKRLLGFWLLFGVVPAALTRDGGKHATRLIIILPPLIFFLSYGLMAVYRRLKGLSRFIVLILYGGILLSSFIFYQHEYWVHNPWNSERWWHYGWEEGVGAVKEIDEDFDRVFISMSVEPAWIFFAGHYEYPPDKWHEGFPFEESFVEGFGRMSRIGKFYFGSPNEDGGGIYGLPGYITDKDLYLANASEVGGNLLLHPEKVPVGLRLIKAVAFPSGEPAFYLFSKDF